ncbi:MAG: translation initiation factor IF-2 subunit gamma [Candidatus Woesearchaeota archaeon]
MSKVKKTIEESVQVEGSTLEEKKVKHPKKPKDSTQKKEKSLHTEKKSTHSEENVASNQVHHVEKQEKVEKKILAPEINIGLVGHVDHGKTTLTKSLSGVWTDTHSEEIKRGITIRLGYADAIFYKCDKCQKYGVKEKCSCGHIAHVLRKVSFVDAPGHETLMATMLAGSNIMDGALLLISANENCPQPQTREHLTALKIMGIKKIVIVQNKIDLVTKEEAIINYNKIKEFVKGSVAENAPIVPISAIHNANMDKLVEAIQTVIPTPIRSDRDELMIHIARSFDINKPGSDPTKVIGGVLGGTVVSGILKVGEEIEIRPGKKVEFEGKISYKPITTKVMGLKTGGQDVQEVHPGGSIGILTGLDPSIVRSDMMTGSAIGRVGKLPPTWNSFSLETHLLERVVGSKDELIVEPIKLHEPLMLNVNSAATVGVVMELKKGIIFTRLKLPVCANEGSRVTISRMVGNRWRLIGYGNIKQ